MSRGEVAGEVGDRLEVRRDEPRDPVLARRSAVARNAGRIALGALLTAALTFGASWLLPATWTADAVIRVSTGTGASSGRDAVAASNELAAQFSQLVETAAVTGRAAELAETTPDAVAGRVQASVPANQNVIKVSARAGTPAAARELAQAAATVLADVARRSQQDTVAPVLREQIADLDTSIAAAQAQQDRVQRAAGRAESGSTRQAVLQAELTGLIGKIAQLQFRRLQLQQDTALRNAEYAVTLTQLGALGEPRQQSPRPGIYALVAFAVAALAGAQAASTFGGRR